MQHESLTLGLHVFVDAWGAPSDRLDDPELVEATAAAAAQAAGATLINLTVHQFSPQGVTAVATLAESHLALHTWPEYGYFGLDMFLCGVGTPEKAVELACDRLGATGRKVREIERTMPTRLAVVTEGEDRAEPPVARSPAA
ncbi:MAG: adenosylmethionine decarboxylase [Acidobacteriota bacterium]|nr:adenosylmethionine decarboxylase [Acidobacteriota bacterium]